MPVPDGAGFDGASYRAEQVMSSLKQSLLRVFRASVTEAIRRAVAFDDGLEVAEVLDCLEELTADLASGHLLKEEP